MAEYQKVDNEAFSVCLQDKIVNGKAGEYAETNGCDSGRKINEINSLVRDIEGKKDQTNTNTFSSTGFAYLTGEGQSAQLWKHRIISALLNEYLLVVGIGCCKGSPRSYSNIVGFRAKTLPTDEWQAFKDNFKDGGGPVMEQQSKPTAAFVAAVKKNKYITTRIHLLMLESFCSNSKFDYLPISRGDCRTKADQTIAKGDKGQCGIAGKSIWSWKCLKEVEMEMDDTKCGHPDLYWESDAVWTNQQEEPATTVKCKNGIASRNYYDDDDEGSYNSYARQIYAIPKKSKNATTTQ
jgi:hypothetical protein